jgi:hypothetical protein
VGHRLLHTTRADDRPRCQPALAIMPRIGVLDTTMCGKINYLPIFFVAAAVA